MSDTSPIRALSHLGRLELLAALFQEIVVPTAVVEELEQPRPTFAPVAVRGLPFVCVRSPQDRDAVDALRETLGPGEAEAIILAEELHAEAILIDETAGRAVALRHGLRPIGVLGTLLRGKESRTDSGNLASAPAERLALVCAASLDGIGPSAAGGSRCHATRRACGRTRRRGSGSRAPRLRR